MSGAKQTRRRWLTASKLIAFWMPALTAITGKSRAENTKGGITYDAAMPSTADEATI